MLRVAALCLALSLCAPLRAQTTTPALSADQISAIDRFVNSQMKNRQIPGVAVGVYSRGQVLLAKGYGLSNVELSVPVRTKGTVTISRGGSIYNLSPRRTQSGNLDEKGESAMSNHFTGLSLGPPMGDQRLDLCDLYAFQSPADPNKTVIILNANPNADALHPDAIYRLNIDNDGDYLNDLAFSYVFSKPQNGRQTVNVFVAKGQESRSVEAVGTKIIADGEVSFGTKPNIINSGPYTFFAGSRSDAFFFDFDGIKNLFDTRGKRNFTEPHLAGKSPWAGVDSNTEANVFSTVIELPTSELNPKPEIHIWGRCSVRCDGKLLHVDRAGHPSVSSFFNTDDTKEEYNASEPVNDRKRWLEQFVHLLGHTGNYTREEAIAAIDTERTLPDVLSFDPSKPAKYPNGRTFMEDVINYRLAFLTKNECPPTGLKPHNDILKEFPYIGTPHVKRAAA